MASNTWQRRCMNCYQDCSGMFCSLECASERYAITHENLGAVERQLKEVRESFNDLVAAAASEQKAKIEASGTGGTLFEMGRPETEVPSGIDPPVS